MNDFIRPCAYNECESPTGEDTKNTLCKGIGETIIKAGGTGVFEATTCSLEALDIITKAEGERAAELREKLGIVRLANVTDLE